DAEDLPPLLFVPPAGWYPPAGHQLCRGGRLAEGGGGHRRIRPPRSPVQPYPRDPYRDVAARPTHAVARPARRPDGHRRCGRARRLVDLGGPFGNSPARTVLYDPEHPRRALLCLEELPEWVRVTPDGVWEAAEDPKASSRMAWLALCGFGGLPLGWILGLILR